MTKLLMIGACGAAGAVCRYATGLICLRLLGGGFAFGTLTVNVVGCFLLGLAMQLMQSETIHVSNTMHLAITAGFLGALTTFSTFGYETLHHAMQGEWGLAGLNIAANLALGLLAVGGGIGAARLIG